jgi:putative membrane protein
MRVAAMVAAGLVGLVASGCHKTGANAGNDVKNPAQSAPVNTVQDVAAGPVGLASAATAGGFTTAGFIQSAARGDMYEIAAGKIALERSKTSQVKDLAQMMITDHQMMSDKLKAAIADNHLPPAPSDQDERRKGMLDNLKASGDSDFDLAYLHQQLAAHLEALTLMKGFQDHGDNAALKTVAAGAAPIVEHHLGMVRDVGGDKLKAIAGKD